MVSEISLLEVALIFPDLVGMDLISGKKGKTYITLAKNGVMIFDLMALVSWRNWSV